MSLRGVLQVTQSCPAVDVSPLDGERATVDVLPPGLGRHVPCSVVGDAREQNGYGTERPASGSRDGPDTPGPRRGSDPAATRARAVLHAAGGVRAVPHP